MGERPRRSKIDVPFVSDSEIADMVDQFERCSWPYERWTHRAHLAVAVTALLRFPIAEAVDRVRRQIQLYNRTCGDPDGYHETLTLLYMRKVDRYLVDHPEAATLREVVESLASACDMSWPLEYYSADRLWSAAAKVGWIEPDRRPLDF